MKKVKLLLLAIIPIFLCSCQSNLSKTTDNLSKAIIEAHHTQDVNIKKLNKKEKEIFNNFLEKQKRENRIVNISENVYFSEESDSNGNITYGLYEENGEYFIKYTDIQWKKLDNDYVADINVGEYANGLFKSLVPILYEDTHDVDKYNYRFEIVTKKENSIDYHYKSIADGSGLIIRYYVDGNNIKNISTIYQDIFFIDSDEVKYEERNIALQILLAAFIVGLLTGGIIIGMKYLKNII